MTNQHSQLLLIGFNIADFRATRDKRRKDAMADSCTLPILVTVSQLVEQCPWLTEKALRMMIFRAEETGFSCCIRRIGRKVLIDLDSFRAWLDEQQQ